MSKECDVCSGQGSYPIIDCFGTERYAITCPECFGTGFGDETEDEEPGGEPLSTAARIKSVEEMREHVAKHWTAVPSDTRDGAAR